MAEPLLVAEDVQKRFGGLRAVDGMSVQVREGELVGLIGPNGAGKSTFFDCVSGFRKKDRGSVRFAGQDITRARRHAIARSGLTRTFQSTSALERMTVVDNLMLGAGDQPGEGLFGALRRRRNADADAKIREHVDAAMDFLGLTHLADAYGGSLSGGQKKLLDLGRALMTEPRMMLLDEPLAGVNPTLRRGIMARIKQLQKERGMTFLLVEHDVPNVFDHCDRVIVMADGRLLVEGTPDEVRGDPQVKEAYLGA